MSERLLSDLYYALAVNTEVQSTTPTVETRTLLLRGRSNASYTSTVYHDPRHLSHCGDMLRLSDV